MIRNTSSEMHPVDAYVARANEENMQNAALC